MKEVVLDIDQTLLDNLSKLHRGMNLVGKFVGWNDLPTLEEMIDKGGTHAAYAHIPAASKFNERLNGSKYMYRNVPEVPGSVEGVSQLNHGICRPVAYLTARPEHLKDETMSDLVKAGFPELPLISKPDHVENDQVSAWKISELERIAESTDDIVVMIDDSVNTAKAILNHNNPKIKPIVFLGPITNPNRVPDGVKMSDWNSMLTVIEQL